MSEDTKKSKHHILSFPVLPVSPVVKTPLTLRGTIRKSLKPLRRNFVSESLPEVGAPAPEFTVATNSGETVSLADFKGKENVVLFFYPKADTPGCTIEACNFRDNLARFKA